MTCSSYFTGGCQVAEVRDGPVSISTWIDACDGGTRGPSDWDAWMTWPMELPFEVRMFGETARRLWVQQDGHFDLGATPQTGINYLTDNPRQRAWVVAPYWTTLRPRTVDSAVCSKLVGTTGAHIAVVEWRDLQSPEAPGSRLTMEAQLHESDGSLRLLYQTVDTGRAPRLPDAVIRGAEILNGVDWSIPYAALRSGFGVAFTPR